MTVPVIVIKCLVRIISIGLIITLSTRLWVLRHLTLLYIKWHVPIPVILMITIWVVPGFYIGVYVRFVRSLLCLLSIIPVIPVSVPWIGLLCTSLRWVRVLVIILVMIIVNRMCFDTALFHWMSSVRTCSVVGCFRLIVIFGFVHFIVGLRGFIIIVVRM